MRRFKFGVKWVKCNLVGWDLLKGCFDRFKYVNIIDSEVGLMWGLGGVKMWGWFDLGKGI